VSKSASKRWAPRKKAMVYAGESGPTHFNQLIKSGKIRAKKDGTKVLVDLDSVDAYIEALPDATAVAK
jgi:excisionase family DNA binding protein